MSFSDKNPSSVITGHIAWHGKLNQFMSELFLHSHKPMSYILWQSEQESHYFFSYVLDVFTTCHKLVLFDPTTLLWKSSCEQTVYENRNFHQILQCIMTMQTNLHGNWQAIIHPSKKPIQLLNYKEIYCIR